MNRQQMVLPRPAPATLPGLAPFALAAGLVLFTALLGAANWTTDISAGWRDPDSMLRLVEVRDWLAGQGWYDLTQRRMAPPGGVFMHWSRLVDVPIAALILLAEPFVGRTAAETLAVNLWPPLVFLAFGSGIAAAAHRLGGWTAVLPAVLLVATTPFLTGLFLPGRIDHHNVQLALMAWMLTGLVRAGDRGRAPLLSGVAAAASLAVGMEMLPLIVAGAIGLAVLWIVEGERWRSALIGIGIGLSAGTLLLFFATVGPERRLVAACDALSITYVTLAVVGGLGTAATAAVLRSRHNDGAPGTLMRGGALVGLGSLLVTITGLAFPACLAGPYGEVDPRLGPIWLDHIGETWSAIDLVRREPANAAASFLPPLLALLVGVLARRFLPAWDRPRVALVMGLLAVTLLVALTQQRALPAAQMLAALIGGAAAAAFAAATAGRDDARAILARKSWILLTPVLWMIAAVPLREEAVPASEGAIASRDAACRDDVHAVLSPLPPGLVAAPVNLGALLLATTPHSVLSAPYHRNLEGSLAGDGLMASPDGHAEAAALGVRYVALCKADPEIGLLTARAPDGLFPRLARGERPGWLEVLSDTGDALILEARSPQAAEDADDLVTGSLPDPDLRPSLDP